MSRVLLTSLLLTAACFVDAGVSPPDPASTTSAATPSSTTEPTTTLVDPTTSSTTSSTTGDLDPSSADDTTTAAPASCWDLGANGWPDVGDPLEIGDAIDPYLGPDGLSLHYLDSDRRPHRTTRTDRATSFTPGVRLAEWFAAPVLDIRFPVVLRDGELMLLAIDGNIQYALRSDDPDDQYTVPKKLPGPVNGLIDKEVALTATADGALLIVQRDDGPPVPPLDFSYRFHQFTRDPADIDAEYDNGLVVTPYVPPLGFAACPALSPDGLHLFFTSTDAESVEFEKPETIAIYYTSRASVTAGWNAPFRLGTLRGASPDEGVACVSSVTADGCELTYYTFLVGAEKPPSALYVAARAP